MKNIENSDTDDCHDDDEKDRNLARVLVGTCASPDFAPDVTFKPKEENSEPNVMRARCTYCSDEKKRFIRNRTTQGIYYLTKKELVKFTKIGKFKISFDGDTWDYIMVANFCDFCKDENKEIKQEVKLYLKSEYKLPKY